MKSLGLAWVGILLTATVLTSAGVERAHATNGQGTRPEILSQMETLASVFGLQYGKDGRYFREGKIIRSKEDCTIDVRNKITSVHKITVTIESGQSKSQFTLSPTTVVSKYEFLDGKKLGALVSIQAITPSQSIEVSKRLMRSMEIVVRVTGVDGQRLECETLF